MSFVLALNAGSSSLKFALYEPGDPPARGLHGKVDRIGASSRALTPPFIPRTKPVAQPLSPKLLKKMDAYWRAANYLSVGQIYLYDNPLLKKPLKIEHVKPRLLGHWGTTPGLNFIYVHLNRIIKAQDLNVLYVTGPGHGGPGLVANTYLEGTYTERYPAKSTDSRPKARGVRTRCPSPTSPEIRPICDCSKGG